MSAGEGKLGELRRILDQKRQFIIDTLHEIRTPLAGIRRLAEHLRGGVGEISEEDLRRKLDLILDSSGQLGRLVDDLLQLERLEAGEVLYEFVHFHIADLISELVDIGEALLGEKKGKIELRWGVSRDLPPVHGDVRKIRQVLLNFLGNAIRFTREGYIRVSARPLGDYVEVAVEDTGIGIAEDEKGIVFEQFRTAGRAISPEYEGAGLGLSLNKKIVEAHRGEIGLASELGRGSCFTFTLPTCASGILPAVKRLGPGGKKLDRELTYEPARGPRGKLSLLSVYDDAERVVPPELPAPVRKEARYRKTVRGHGERILIVEDSPVTVEILRDLLGRHRYRVLVAPDGPTALAQIEEEPPDLLVTRIWLPLMSGFDLVKKVREREEARLLPILLLSARRNPDDIAYGLNLGADDYVVKPFDRAEFLARIGVLLRLRRTQEELLRLNRELEKKVAARTAELAAARESLYLSEKLKSLGQLTAGIAHELNNPLSYVLSNVTLVKERLAARDVLRAVRRVRSLMRAAGDENTRLAVEEEFLAGLGGLDLHRRDVADYRAEVETLDPAGRRARFREFLSYLEGSATSRGGASRDLFEGAVRLLGSAEEGLERVRDIVRDLSAFSHPGTEEAGRADLRDCVERVLRILAPAVKAKEIRVTRSLRLKEPVRAAVGRVDQVLMNLLQNAIQASPPGGTIRIRTRRDGKYGRIEIEDRGPGIPEEDHSRVFDPFFTTKTVGEGTGLGLAICYRIVERMSGEITFRSRPGKGTTFVVRLPLAEVTS